MADIYDPSQYTRREIGKLLRQIEDDQIEIRQLRKECNSWKSIALSTKTGFDIALVERDKLQERVNEAIADETRDADQLNLANLTIETQEDTIKTQMLEILRLRAQVARSDFWEKKLRDTELELKRVKRMLDWALKPETQKQLQADFDEADGIQAEAQAKE